MHEVNISVNTSNNILEILASQREIGTQFDDNATKLKWTIPQKYKGYTTKLIFWNETEDFEPLYIDDTEIPTVFALTQERQKMNWNHMY